MSNSKRTYTSKTREAQALQTRSRILSAAKKLFQKEGFEAVTIEKLAEAAEVSMPTIYALFQSKRGILRALMDEALPPDQFQALVEESGREKSAKRLIEICVKIARQLYEAETTLMDVSRGASVLAPELKELEKEREERRFIRQEETIKKIAAEKGLAKGLTVAKARDIVWAFTGRDFYRLLVIERGWSADEYEKWVSKILITTLIGLD